MRIDGIGHSPAFTRATSPAASGSVAVESRPRPTAPPIEPAKGIERVAGNQDDDDDKMVHDGESPDASPGEPRGVLRLLEAGHFQGVADVRLRINFFDELSAQAAEDLGQAVKEGTSALTDAISQKADELLSAFATDDEMKAMLADKIDQFAKQVQDTASAANSGETVDQAGLIDALNSSFADMIEGIDSLLGADGQPDDTAPIPTTDSADQTLEPTSPPESEDKLAAAINSLKSAFADALAAFQDSLETASILPDPAPSPWHGSAYDKFLGIYDSLRFADAGIDKTA